MAPEVTEAVALFGGLDALGDGDEVERPGDPEHGGDDRGVPNVVSDAGHEGGVDLDGVHRVPPEVAEG